MSLENTTYDEFGTIIERPSRKTEVTPYKPITVVSSENGGGGRDSLAIQESLDKTFDAVLGTGAVKPKQEKSSLTITPWINDDGPWKAQDNGKSFGFSGEYASPEWRIGGRLDAFTKNTGFDTKKRTVLGTHIDHAEFYAMKKVGEVQRDVGKIVGFAGMGVQGIGNFGGSNIQNWWHENGPAALTTDKTGKRYSHGQTYEVGNDGKPVSGWTPDIRLRAEGKTEPLIGDEKYGVSLIGRMDAKIPLVQKYGETAITATAGIEAKMDRIQAELSATTHIYRNLPASDTIRSAMNNPNNSMVARISADVWRSGNTTISPYIAVERSLDKNTPADSKMRGMIGVKISF